MILVHLRCLNKAEYDLVLCQLVGHDEQLNWDKCIRSGESRSRTDGLIKLMGYHFEKIILEPCWTVQT